MSPWRSQRVTVVHGIADKRIETGEEFETQPVSSLWTLEPTARPKHQALAILPSLYHDHDAREHAAQRERGKFVLLCGDVDHGDQPIERIEQAVLKTFGAVAYLIYSTANSVANDRRWRIFLPLAEPAGYADWRDAGAALADLMRPMGIELDCVTTRPGQIMFLPNVPAQHDKTGQPLRDGSGRPLYFDSRASGIDAPGLRLDTGSIAEAIADLRRRQAEDERLREQIRANAARRRAHCPASDGDSLIDGFNRANRIEDLLPGYRYEQSPRDSLDWRSPHQESKTYATRIFDGRWISLSGSDTAAGIGVRHAAGCSGDAFDLYVHYEHGGDRTAALRELGRQRDRERPLNGSNYSVPPPQQDGDPGWTEAEAEHRQGESIHLREGFNPITRDTIEAEPEELLPIADLSEWAKSPAQPKGHLLADRIPEHEVVLFTGIGGANKSTYGHQLAASHAAGRSMLGIATRAGIALYVTAEDHSDRLHWNNDHICKAIGVDPAALAGKLHLSSLRGRLNNELATFDGENRLRPTPTFRMLKRALKTTGATLLVLDNVAHLYPDNENDRAKVTAFVNLLYSLCIEHKVTILLIGHPNKAGDAYSGTTAWLNAVRAHLTIECPDPQIDPDERVLKVGKANYARPGTELRFRWHDFALWLDDDLPSDTRAELAAVIRANGENAAFMRCLAVATEARRAVSHQKGTNYFGAAFTSMPAGKGTSLKGFEAAFERLLSRGEIELDQPLWKRDNRVWKYGIRAAEKRTDPPAPTPRTDPHRPPPEVVDIACTAPHAPTPPSTTYFEGAAFGSAAPPDEGEDEPDYLAGWGTAAEAGR